MFSNIGGKIKGCAKFFCWVGIIASVVSGVGMAISDEDMILIGIGTAVGGALVSWIGSFITYGFGELIDNSSRILEELKK